MNINIVRVKVNSEAQMRIAMTLLQEISGKKIYGEGTVEDYIRKWGKDYSDSVSLSSSGDCILSHNEFAHYDTPYKKLFP